MTNAARPDRSLFSPRGIAIVGASDDPNRPGGQCLQALLRAGYTGGIYPVNPRLSQAQGQKCIAAVADIDGTVDVAVIALGAETVNQVIEECGRRGIAYAVVLGAGFREAGAKGAILQDEMVATARRVGVRIIGPNCLGFANIHEGVFAAFGSLTREPFLSPGPVSIVTQSGGFGSSLAYACHMEGIGFRILVSSGNEADLNAPGLIDALLDDDKTEMILAYLEGVEDGRALMALGERALQTGKPVLVWKAGKTRQGARAAATHTAKMTSSYDAWRAALRQSGLIEVRSVEEAVTFIKLLQGKKLPLGRNVAVVTMSGGAAVVYADAADECNLTLPALGADTKALLHDTFPTASSLLNPIDLQASSFNHRSKEAITRAMKAVIDDPHTDQLCGMFAALSGESLSVATAAFIEVNRTSSKPMAVCTTFPRDLVRVALEDLKAAGIPVLKIPASVARAQAMLADFGEGRRRLERKLEADSLATGATVATVATVEDAVNELAGPTQVFEPLPAQMLVAGAFDEIQSKRIVSACLPVTQDLMFAVDGPVPEDLQITYPVVVKIVSPDIAHKSDIGGVIVNVKNRADLVAACTQVTQNARTRCPAARLTGVLIAEMIPNGIETLVGVTNDAVFGPVVAFGLGGVLTEVLGDISYRIAPFDADEARAMVGELRASRIFSGVRGSPAADVDALVAALVNISQFAWQQKETIAEIDINPLLVRPKGQGVIAVDALVVPISAPPQS